MRKRHDKKLWRTGPAGWERMKRYGLYRSRGHRSTRRGRRHFLRRNESMRDRHSLPIARQIEFIQAQLDRMRLDRMRRA